MSKLVSRLRHLFQGIDPPRNLGSGRLERVRAVHVLGVPEHDLEVSRVKTSPAPRPQVHHAPVR